MNRFIRNAVLSCAVTATTLATLPAAQAGNRWDRRHEVTRQNDDSDVLVAGLLGLAVGAIIVSAISQPEPRAILDRDPYDDIDPYHELGYFPPAPQEEAREIYFEEPTPPDNWDINDRSWYKYCEDMYRWGKSRGGKMSCSD